MNRTQRKSKLFLECFKKVVWLAAQQVSNDASMTDKRGRYATQELIHVLIIFCERGDSVENLGLNGPSNALVLSIDKRKIVSRRPSLGWASCHLWPFVMGYHRAETIGILAPNKLKLEKVLARQITLGFCQRLTHVNQCEMFRLKQIKALPHPVEYAVRNVFRPVPRLLQGRRVHGPSQFAKCRTAAHAIILAFQPLELLRSTDRRLALPLTVSSSGAHPA